MVVPKAKPPKPAGATLDSALARQARAKKNFCSRGGTADGDAAKMEEARAEMASADKAVNEARELAVQDTVIFADVEVLVQALRMQPQQKTLDPAAREALARMSDAPTSMRSMQQAQQQEPTPTTLMTPRILRERSLSKNCMSRRKQCCEKPCDKRRTLQLDKARKGRKRLTAEELRDGLENDLGEKWTEIDEELRSSFVQAVNDRFAHH